jgi:multiple sugar transport system substrate-binding protein
MQRVKARAGEDRYAILLPMNEWEVLVALAMENGAALLRDGDRYGDFRAPAFRTAFEFYLGLFRRGLAPQAGAAQIANLYQDFAAGFFTFYVSGPWNLREFARRLPDRLQPAWATAPMPSLAGERPGVSLAGGASLALLRGTPRADVAWRLVEFLTEPRQQLAFYQLSGDLPSRPSAWADPALASDPRARAFRAQLEHVRATPKIPEWERIADELSRWSEAAIRGELAPDAALAQLDAEVDALLAKRRSLLERAGPAR